MLLRSPLAKLAVAYFGLLTLWWLKISFLNSELGLENYLFNLSYLFFNLLGGIGGLVIASKKWGGFKSNFGRGLSFLSLGLLSQSFGLVIWTYYNIVLKVEVPYPSLADIGYFGLIPFYILAMLNFAPAMGVNFALRTVSGKIMSALVPLVVFLISYLFFLSQVGWDSTNLIKSLLDLGYPAGESLSVALALSTYLLSRKLLGGKMRLRLIFMIFALSFQFITEFTFLYTSGKGLYYNASFVDLMYAAAYFLMTLSLLSYSHLEA